MEILKDILSIIGISTTTIYILAKITACVFTTKNYSKKDCSCGRFYLFN